jgi:glycosyltransferase involved in cell wall biosynthesis
MFCGRIHRLKMPGFFVAVCQAVAARRESCRVLVVGDGPERTAILASLDAAGIDFVYAGFVPPAELRRHYMSARLLLFPTLSESWGLVANEAMASGTPVITVPGAGCAGDLVIDGVNGRVVTAEVDIWVDAVCKLLDDPELWSEWSHAAMEQAGQINYQDAARGILDACNTRLLSPDGRSQDS